ncbi:oxygenase MpaB family protein [Gordonia sp. NB41Y]|uniref:oxygenase MpaB family protein n=1 Tax=Gordonia sp. NB41Y TaxID=875808 RepID=UPI0002C006CD|nr:oxygenase MpaB family protein [Gordonia sp. NB41Y]WLP91274.1 oxygenase MpaB family protein [Gordonia sp. NB41Y]
MSQDATRLPTRHVDMPLVYRYLGDRRFAYALPRALTLQILHPGNAAGLVAHVPRGLWTHKQRAVSEMIYIAYSNRDLTSVIRTAHAHVKGVDGFGDRYHALDPDLFFFQHATYVDTLFTAVDTFDHRLDADERDLLYRDCCRWYAKYDISARIMPTTYREFVEWFDDYCATRLRTSPDSDSLRERALNPNTWYPARVPSGAVRALLHPRACELLGVEVSRSDRMSLRAFTFRTTLLATLIGRHAMLIPAARHDPDN